MTKSDTIKGKCLCGAVAFTSDSDIQKTTACHCSQCRAQNGGGAFHSIAFDGALSFQNDAGLKWIESSDWAERGFCDQCGTSLFWRMKNSDHYDVSIGVLENPPVTLDAHIFTDDAGIYETIPDDAPHKTGAQVIAEFNESQKNV